MIQHPTPDSRSTEANEFPTCIRWIRTLMASPITRTIARWIPNGPLIPGDAASSQLDTDGDGVGDVCDVDNAAIAVGS